MLEKTVKRYHIEHFLGGGWQTTEMTSIGVRYNALLFPPIYLNRWVYEIIFGSLILKYHYYAFSYRVSYYISSIPFSPYHSGMVGQNGLFCPTPLLWHSTEE